jgi:hypothetical protein
VVVSGSAAVLVGAACLPDLAAFPDEPEAGAIEPSASSYCGDGVIETLEDGGDSGESCDPGDASTSTAGCESCRITCSGTLDRETGHCYFLADATTSNQDALEACRGAAAHVVTIGSEREARLLAEEVDAGGYWIGLAERIDLDENYWAPAGVDEPGWPKDGTGCSGCYARTGDGGLFEPEPVDAGTAERSCLVAGGGVWLEAACSGLARPTLCEREPLGSRLEPCGGALCMTLVSPDVDAGAKRYVVWPSKTTAADAMKTCAASGGSLVMFDSREEREELMREVAQRLGTDDVRIWIGLSRRGDTWTWDDGTPLDGGRPSPWGDRQPAGQGGRAYVVLNDNRYDTQLAQTDEDASSNEKRVFVCQQPLR